MMNCEAIFNVIDLKQEQELNNLIESCHRTIDWSLSLYFKSLKKGISLFADKICDNSSLDFKDAFNKFYVNEEDLSELISDILSHINNEIMKVQKETYPSISFDRINIDQPFELVSSMVEEKKKSLKYSQRVEKTITQFTSKTLFGITPSYVPRSMLGKVNPIFGKKVAMAMTVDTGSIRNDLKTMVQYNTALLLDEIEQNLAEQLKYQLANQLYKWYDH